MNSFTGENALENAKQFLLSETGKFASSEDECDKIMIENRSSHSLEYVTSGYNTGWPVDDVKKSFKDQGDDVYSLPPGSVGTILYRMHHAGGVAKVMAASIFTFGIVATSCTESYFSVRVRTPGKNYIVCCGSTVGQNRCNKAGIQIRGEDGVLDSGGNIVGHGVDATGNVTDILSLVLAVAHATPGGYGAFHQFSEVTRSFEVICKFNNSYHGVHHFIFKDGKE